MADKKEKKSQKSNNESKHVFEVHTMAKDDELKKNGPQKISQKSTTQPSQSQKQKKELNKNAVPATANPFLNQSTQSQPEIKKGSFAPQKKTEPVEKINHTPADIAPKKPTKKPVKKSKNIVHIMMIIFIIIFILGAIGIGIYIFFFKSQSEVIDEPIALPVEDVVVELDLEPVKQVYSSDLPNYFMFDVESVDSQGDIVSELTTIESNMRENDITGPISFIVNDMNNNPVSFHVFALSAGMNMPQDILTSLEENFEIYAYDDPMHGIRFGFEIDVKNINLLQEALTAQETQLPQAFEIILGDAETASTGIIFSDSVHGTHPIRFTNLDEAESYSVDYTLHNRSWLMGSTKKSLRAMIDSIKDSKVPQEESEDFVY